MGEKLIRNIDWKYFRFEILISLSNFILFCPWMLRQSKFLIFSLFNDAKWLSSNIECLHLFLFVECLVALGYKREDIEASLAQTRYDDVHATYLLISRKNTDVSRFTSCPVTVIHQQWQRLDLEMTSWLTIHFYSRNQTVRDRALPYHCVIWLVLMRFKPEPTVKCSRQLTGESTEAFPQQVRIRHAGLRQVARLYVSFWRLRDCCSDVMSTSFYRCRASCSGDYHC